MRRVTGDVVLDAAVVAAILGGFVAAWEAYVRLADLRPFVLPPPTRVAETFWHTRDLILTASGETTKAFLGGFAIAVVVGVGAAALIVAVPRLGRGIYPLVVASQTVPVIAIAPLLIIWLGFGIWTKIVVSALIAFFPIVVTSVAGFRSVPSTSLDLMRSLPSPALTTFRKLVVPSALPSMFAGFRTASVLAVIGAVVGEFVAGGRGLASGIVLAKASLQTDRVIANIVALSILGLLFYGAVALAERLATPWRYSTVKRRRGLAFS